VATAVVSGRVSAAILEHARGQGVDVIAVATHANGGLKRLLLGCVADQIHRQSPIPVLVHRCPCKLAANGVPKGGPGPQTGKLRSEIG
jgi:nucleotide-binding universal stress UspA family protein